MIKVGVIGGAGYTGGELIRLLMNHPEVSIEFVQSESQKGLAIADIHQDLTGETDLKFGTDVQSDTDVIFVCSGHGKSKAFLEDNSISNATKIIDLSQDFRLKANDTLDDRKFIYGLPEYNKESIIRAENIANPGCFATAIQLALLPLFHHERPTGEVHVNAVTGSTGAGQSLTNTSHFSWRNNNISVYKAFSHQHLAEIGETLTSLQPNFDAAINFIPMRGNFTRGILANVYTDTALTLEKATDVYNEYYASSPFTFVIKNNINLKQVINTNKCFLYLEKHQDKLLISSIIDNLLKGASGQAVQNMNLLFGLPEKTGLSLKPTSF